MLHEQRIRRGKLHAGLGIHTRASRKTYESFEKCRTDENDLTYFIAFVLGCIDECRRNNACGDRGHRIAAAEGGLNARQSDIVMEMREEGGTFSVYEMMNRQRIPYLTARSDMLKLPANGDAELAGKSGNRKLYRMKERATPSPKPLWI